MLIQLPLIIERINSIQLIFSRKKYEIKSIKILLFRQII